ncbi:hypothetical protein OKJ48_04345 [Streptomyces kunmingensis]|uniref:Large membrane protein n=1 Tax=Streptomyces kunmingensis TaxID=68225 RepID=A0ABU6C429_9ACTN|nr:hypothetical protein [Streptomyces kunmingensis]MEB3959486.1 hypothetical protein [Streptomyces kunmingensis]
MSTEEQTQDRHRRRRTLAVASVAAAVLLAGGGGAYLATSASGGGGGEDRTGGPGGDGTPPPLALDGYAKGGGPGTTNGIAPGEPDPNGTRYRASGDLPDGPGEAPVYRAEGEVSAAEVAALGKALDVGGTPRLVDGAWRLGPAQDGSGPSLQVNREAPGTWTYAKYAPSIGHKCAGKTKCADPAGGGSEKDAVSEAVAKETAAPVLKALGQDDAKLEAAQLMGATRVVNADPKVGGLPTYGWSTGIQVGSDGQVTGGSGQLKAPVEGDTYPTVGAKETLERLNSTAAGDRASVGGCASAAPLDGGARSSGPGTEQGAGCTPSSPRPPASATVAVTGATFGLAAHFVEGRQALVPSWLFRVEPAGAGQEFTVTHPAVQPKFLVAPGSSTSPSASASGGPGSDSGDVRVEGYGAAGRTLTLHFSGGVCATYAAAADESGGKVTVRVTSTEKKGTVCIQMAKFFTLPVTLDAPLDDRKVVGTDGAAVPPAQKNGPGGAVPAPRN